MSNFASCMLSAFLASSRVLASAPAAGAQFDLKGFDSFMVTAMKEFKVPGAAVAIVKDGKILLAKGYGYRDMAHQLPVTSETLFPIASITKSFTVTSLGTLVDEGKLEWDKPAREYLPGFRMHDPVATEQLTVRDMVTHRSGLPRHDLLWYSSSMSREEMVASLRDLEPNKPIREKFQYNNLMFVTAGYLGGRLEGSSWEDLVQKRVLDPIGMRNTKFSSGDARKLADHALPYRKNRKTEVLGQIAFSKWGDVGPAGSMNSSIDDMAKYLLMHLNKGAFEGKQVLGRNNAEQMQSAQMVLQGAPTFPELGEGSYGMGLFIESYRGRKHVSHGGNLDGFSLMLSFLPNEGVGVVVLTNLDGTPLRDLVPYVIYDRLTGQGEIDWVKRFREIEVKGRDQELAADKKGYSGRKEGTRPARDLADYTGEYQHPAYRSLTIRQEGTGAGRKLLMKLNDVERPLEHFHYDTFQVPEDPLDPFEKLRLTFPTDAQGEVSKVESILEPNVKDIVFKRVAEKRMFDPAFLRQFLGEYDFPGQPAVVTFAGESSVQLTFPGAPPYKMLPKHGMRFDIDGMTGVTVEFKPDSNGKIGEMVVYTPGSVFAVPRKK